MSTKNFSEENKFIGRVLHSLRMSKNMTLKEFAKAINMSQGYLSEVERGMKLPGSELFISLKRTFDVDIDDFFQFDHESSRVKDPSVHYVYDERIKNYRKRINNLEISKEEKIEFYEILLDIYEEKDQ